MNIKIPKNHVLVEVSCLRHEKISFESSEIIVDPTFAPEQHAQTNGIVKAIPESLYFNNKDVMQSVEFLVDIDVKVGDHVFFHYLQINNAIGKKQVIYKDGKFYIFIRHDSLFCGIRDNEIIMFNGWMLLKPIEKASEKIDNFNPILPKNRQTFEPLMGEIAHLGKPVKEYYYGKHEADSGINVEKGQIVAFLPHSDIPLEYDMHQSLKDKFFRVQRKELLGIYNN